MKTRLNQFSKMKAHVQLFSDWKFTQLEQVLKRENTETKTTFKFSLALPSKALAARCLLILTLNLLFVTLLIKWLCYVYSKHQNCNYYLFFKLIKQSRVVIFSTDLQELSTFLHYMHLISKLYKGLLKRCRGNFLLGALNETIKSAHSRVKCPVKLGPLAAVGVKVQDYDFEVW